MEPWEHPEARVELLVIQASRQEVLADNTGWALAKLSRLLIPETAKRIRGRLIFSITGYEGDARDLWEIPEVVAWMNKLDSDWPFWFYFMNTGGQSTLSFIAFALCKWDKVSDGKVIPPKELQQFLSKHFVALNDISQRLGDTQVEIDTRSREIADFFVHRTDDPTYTR